VTAYLYECILIFYLHTQLWTLSSSGSLAITTYPEAEYKFHVATILLFYFTENNCHNIKIAYFSKIYLYYHTSLQDSSWSNTNVTLKLHKSMPCCYYWLQKIKKLYFWGHSQSLMSNKYGSNSQIIID